MPPPADQKVIEHELKHQSAQIAGLAHELKENTVAVRDFAEKIAMSTARIDFVVGRMAKMCDQMQTIDDRVRKNTEDIIELRANQNSNIRYNKDRSGWLRTTSGWIFAGFVLIFGYIVKLFSEG